jgi:hypothetical protein
MVSIAVMLELMDKNRRGQEPSRRPLLRPSERQAFAERVRGSEKLSATLAVDKAPATPMQAQLPKEPKPSAPTPYRRLYRWRLAGGVIFIVIVILGAYLFFTFQDAGTLPKNVTKASNLTLYYPTKLPKGYRLDQSTAKYSGGVVFFTLKDVAGNRQVVFTEQAAPANPPDFDAIQKSYSNFKKISIAGGQGVIGTYRQAPTAIILTNTTLINMSGSSNTPLDTATALVKSLQSLPQ